MALTEVSERSEVDQHLSALISNSGAIRAITEAVQGTLGPKGLDCMLVDQYGGVMVTNDGVTILKTMDVNHPAARILISAVEHQEEQVGDGTTTAALIAGSLIAEGVNQVIKGVPVIKVIEGMKTGIGKALELLEEAVIPLEDLNSPVLERIALIAGRDHRDLAELIIGAARILGGERLKEPGFKLADQVVALEGAESELIQGAIIDKEPLNREMPRQITSGKIIILDDALEPHQINYEALGTEAGFQQQLHNEQDLHENIRKLSRLGVKAIFAGRSISDQAEDLLTDLGMIGVQGVAMHEWRRLAELSGARPIKKDSLYKPDEDWQKLAGEAAAIIVDEKFKQIRVIGQPGRKLVTILVGAYTKEVVGERERIAKDAAAAVQAAWCSGVVPGGGSIELGLARKLQGFQPRGMAAYGYGCVIEALKRPITQICANAGFNPLEKVEEVQALQEERDSYSLGVNCDTGAVEDLVQLGVWDPYEVKYCAIRSAGEVGEAILRINTIIKMKEEKGFSSG
jgi:archaeal chaperonin